MATRTTLAGLREENALLRDSIKALNEKIECMAVDMTDLQDALDMVTKRAEDTERVAHKFRADALNAKGRAVDLEDALDSLTMAVGQTFTGRWSRYLKLHVASARAVLERQEVNPVVHASEGSA